MSASDTANNSTASRLRTSSAMPAATGAKVATLVKDMMSTMDAPWVQQMLDRQMQNFSDLGGLPVLTRSFDEGKPLHESTMKSIRTESIPSGQFESPADYKKRDLPSVGAGAAQP